MAIRPMWKTGVAAVVVAVLAGTGCGQKTPPVARPVAPGATGATTRGQPSGPPQPIVDPALIASGALREETMASRSVDDLNRESPLKPVFFLYDSAEVSAEAQSALTANAGVLKQFPTWTITIEGHCDERGTAEYNLALGERRAAAARSYLIALGVPADRLRTVSYGKEFPFDPGSGEAAWSKNRRAHFVITAK